MKRRLAAILVGDVVGYSAMVEADEKGECIMQRVSELDPNDPEANRVINAAAC